MSVPGSHYRSARLRSREVVDAMVATPPSKSSGPALEDFDTLRHDLADIKDLLLKLTYVTAHTDPKKAPAMPRPEMPWDARRDEIASAKSIVMRSILVPWETDAAELAAAKATLLEEISKGR